MSGSMFGSANSLFDPGSAVAQQSSIFGTPAPTGGGPGLDASNAAQAAQIYMLMFGNTPTNALAPQTTPPAAAPAAPAAAPAPTPQTALSEANAWANTQDQNVYHVDPATAQGQLTLGVLADAGFPMFQNPAAIQDHLAQIAQGTIQVPGISQQQAYDEFMRQINGGGYGSSYGSGGTG